MKIKRTAFTLAEVLITLGIIGVVAAMTMPALITNYKKAETITRLKKAYSIVQQAIKLSEAENGPIVDWNVTLKGHDFFETYIKDFVQYTEELDNTSLSSKVQRKLLNGSNYTGTTFTGANATSFFLLDGAMVTLNLNSTADNGLWVGLDVNGLAKPNQIGRDTFLFFCSPVHGLQPVGGKGIPAQYSYGEYSHDKIIGTNHNDSCNKTKSGYWCSALIMNDGWEIKDDYPW
ncbi:MAG: type II secretion system GspH family protein [Heliobacteriaceae bacterium]|jgi:prepilin-type N-terminal cleavage/methylation domain-containing protein|nr:type II secretion system GspH family protein [Heliobacteriaceae bacterium]